MADGAALVLTGAPGAGKSAVLESLSGLLGDEGVGHAAFESEQLAWGEPWLSLEATMPQLAALCRLQRHAGRQLFLISATTETEAELRAVLAAVAPARHLVVCLAAEPATVAARIAAREPGSWSGKARLVEHARELAAVIPALAGIDLVLPTEGEAADDVARRVRGAMAAHGMLGS
jgi:energy-coupling factor transporter ATP-binding protein EcfA2